MTTKIYCAVIIGATSGTGLELAIKLNQTGVKVIAIGRTAKHIAQISARHPTIEFVLADSSINGVAVDLLDKYNPELIVLAGGTRPVMASITDQQWQQFSDTWNNDVKMTFAWAQALLTSAVDKPRLFISMSSGASINGSPLSGGYAGAKRMQTFIGQYAQREANLQGKPLSFITALPKQMMQGTAIAEEGSKAYAKASNKTSAQFMSQWDTPLTAQLAAQQLMDIIADGPKSGSSYALTGNGSQIMD